MDTNVVLARFAPRDPVHAAARKFFSSPGERIISPVSIVEMNAVLSRESIGLEVPAFLSGETGSRTVRAVSEYFIRFLGLRIESLTLTVRLSVGDVSGGRAAGVL